MADVHHFPLTEFAENKVLDAGDILEALKTQVPLEDLSKISLRYKTDHKDLTPYEALMNLALGFSELAKAMQSHQLHQEMTAIIAKGRADHEPPAA